MNKYPEPDAAATSQGSTKADEGGNWRAWYLLVLAVLAVEIVGFALITNYFA